MKKSMLRAGVAGLLAMMLISAPQAYAKGKPGGGGGGTTPENMDEWKLINLIGKDANGVDFDLRTSTNASVKVGLFDGLTYCPHTELAGHCLNHQIPGGKYVFYDHHGTHTAGIISGKTVGVAPGVQITNYAVFAQQGYVATGNKLIDAWNGAYAEGARIASMSFGCTGTALCFSADEVRAMGTTSMLYVKAAGNDGVDLARESIGVGHGDALAALDRLILVGSVELDKSMSSYSNRAGSGCLVYSGDDNVCDPDMQWMNYYLVAPGSNIYSSLANDGYGLMSGTSMATPMVSGAAALLKSRWPSLTSEQLADILLTTTTDLGASGVDPVFGHGLLNVYQAFQANGLVTLLSTGGGSTTFTTSSLTSSPSLNGLSNALASVSVYDRYGRDFMLGQTGLLRLGRSYNTIHRLLGRNLIGLGSQAEWARAYFDTKHMALGFSGMGSFADPVAATYAPDKTMRMGFDMPFRGGVAQLRMTGSSSARQDFAYDPSLKPLSFFASSALLKSSMFGQTLFNLNPHSRLAVYGTTNAPGTIAATAPGEPLLLQHLGQNSTARLALTGIPSEQRQHGFGVGYWTMPDPHTVIGVNASYLVQVGGYYDMASTLAGLDGTSRLFNLGAVISRAFGSWELSAAGELTNIRTSGSQSAFFELTPSNIASAELRLRKAGVAFSGANFADSLSVALVMPPRAVSGSLKLDYMGPTADRMGRQPYNVRYGLSQLGADPVKVEAGYRLTGGAGWTFDLSGGVNLRQTDYSGRGEALASFHIGF